MSLSSFNILGATLKHVYMVPFSSKKHKYPFFNCIPIVLAAATKRSIVDQFLCVFVSFHFHLNLIIQYSLGSSSLMEGHCGMIIEMCYRAPRV